VAQGKQRDSREASTRLKRYEARQQLNATKNSRRVRDNLIAVAAVVVVAGIAGFAQVTAFESGPLAPTPTPTPTAAGEATTPPGENVGAPSPDLAEGIAWNTQLTLNDTVLDVTLDGDLAPQAVSGILQDIEDSYYPGTTCHRLAADASFLQCGSIDGAGSPDPEFSYGPTENAPVDNVYVAGTIAMARGADQYSYGHQFFIVLSDTTLQDAAGGYTVVGTVTGGLDALAALVAAGVDPATAGGDGSGQPVTPISITAFTVV
jgi:peptidyl-prolyl cis-trans isomerase B (cyclophilin B)